MRIRKATVQDASAMGRVTVDTFLEAHRNQMPEEAWKKRQQEWTYDVSARAWEQALRDIADGTNVRECIYVAETQAEQIFGVAMGQLAATDAAGAVGEVCALYVHPDHQQKGSGRQLVQAVAAHLAQWGITSLQIAVLKANAPARRFYEALGGQIIGERDFDEEGFLLSEVVYGWSDIEILAARDRNQE